MKSILILGAGRSSSSLISYLLDFAAEHNYRVTVGDLDPAAASARVGGHKHGTIVKFDIDMYAESSQVVAAADAVVSLLPPHFHPVVARMCLEHGKHLITASYVSDEMKALDDEAKKKSILLLNECGLDPGIDHMSARQVIDRIHDTGGVITSFESFTGGLIAPETAPENPWRYKFTWNARNVVMAGQGTARYLDGGMFQYIPYQQLFKRTTPVVVPGYGSFEGYANRDSLKYIETYNLRGIQTMIRGTLRFEGYCSAWNVLVQLGCCDDTYVMENVAAMSHLDFISSFLGIGHVAVEQRIVETFHLQPSGPEILRLKWSGFFSDEKIGLQTGTPAQVTEHILNKRWRLTGNDKDLVVMWHRFRYSVKGKTKEIQSSLVAKGSDPVHTAMAKTVGLPMAIAVKLLLQGKIAQRGVVIPVMKEIYEPVLEELGKLGVELSESSR
jgi:saccharopine dehydrogenase (NADP+, L-glutamate forming)